MTLHLAWTRRLHDGTEELWFAGDSRLNGGRRFDCAPKIVALPRSDALMSIAGDIDVAYSVALQLGASIRAYPPASDRAMDICELRGHVTKVLNTMKRSLHLAAPDLDKPSIELLFGGYSWRSQRFVVWRFHYNSAERKFQFETPGWGVSKKRPGLLAVIGDAAWKLRFRTDLERRLGLTGRRTVNSPPVPIDLGMLPFEVLRDLLRQAQPLDPVGGPPQAAKVLRHLNTRTVPIYWPDRASGRITLLGREMAGYESSNHWVLDPDTLDLEEFPIRARASHRQGVDR